MAREGNELGDAALVQLRAAAARTSLRQLGEQHIVTPARFRTVPPDFAHVALSGLVLLAHDRASLTALLDRRVLSSILPEQLESSELQTRLIGGAASRRPRAAHGVAARTLRQLMEAGQLHVEATVTVTRLPWRSRTFEHMFSDATLTRLCTASVSNICAFIVDTHRTALATMVRPRPMLARSRRAVWQCDGRVAAAAL